MLFSYFIPHPTLPFILTMAWLSVCMGMEQDNTHHSGSCGAEATEDAWRCDYSPLTLELTYMGCHVAGDCGGQTE